MYSRSTPGVQSELYFSSTVSDFGESSLKINYLENERSVKTEEGVEVYNFFPWSHVNEMEDNSLKFEKFLKTKNMVWRYVG